MGKQIPLSIPNFCGNELKYTDEAIRDAWVSTGGPFISKFENAVKDYVHADYAVAVQSGTAALHLALLALDVHFNDMVIVPTLTFIASINPVRYVNAEPIFMDCDDSLCMDPLKLKQFLISETETIDGKCYFVKNHKQIKALIIVDVFGNAADKEQLISLAHSYFIKVVEDAAESIGTRCEYGKYAGQYMGTLGDIGAYSFNGNKIITTGGGGMIVTDSKELADRCRYLSTQAKDDTTYFIHGDVGYNYRMTNIQASVGLAQLELLEKFIQIKIENYDHYKSLVEDNTPYKMVAFRDKTRSNHWFYSLLTCGIQDRDNLIRYFSSHQIQTRPIWYLNHKQKPYINSYAYEIENADYYWERVVNLPCSTNLSSDDIEQVLKVLQDYGYGKE